MSGGVELLSNLTLPWNRMMIIAFALFVLIFMALLISKTQLLGLFVRGVTQNRPMASRMGINTARIDTYAFSLGSGIAGLAGCALKAKSVTWVLIWVKATLLMPSWWWIWAVWGN
jgi:urea transport system permease protein